MTAIEVSPPTRGEWVVERLRAAIVVGELPPGSRLRTAELAARFGVSPTPLREALQRLAAEGLVELLPHRWMSPRVWTCTGSG